MGTVLLAITFVGCVPMRGLYNLASEREETEIALPPRAAALPAAPVRRPTAASEPAALADPPPGPAVGYENQGHGFPRLPLPIIEPSLPTNTSRPAAISAPIKRVPSIESATQQVSEQLFGAAAAISGNTLASINDTVELTLTLDPSQSVEGLSAQLHITAPHARTTVVETRTSALAWPELIAPNFDVTPNTAEEQAVTSDGPTTWSWQLKPRAGGEFTVLVDLYAIVYVGDKQTKRKYKTLRQPITITVPKVPWYAKVWDWALEHWDKVWTLMLLPVVGYIWSRFNKKKRKK
jgi:hypothetical protein